MSTEKVLLPDAVVPTHYSLTITTDFERYDYVGEVAIDLDIVRSADSITVHTKEIDIKSAKLVEEGKEGLEAVEITTNLKLSTTKFTFGSEFSTGKGVLTIKFKGVMNADMAGFYRSNYTDMDGNKKVMGSTQFESLDARRAFPCFDEPALKASLSLTLIVPKELCALSNMPEEYCAYLAGGKKKVVFQKSPKMSTYLFAWAVGEFDFVSATTKNGVQVRVYAPPGRGKQGTFALDVAVQSLDFYDDFFKVPYPLPKLDMICITEFAMGAMENWGLVTYRETALMIDENASIQTKQRVAIVVAHELAHQWFGNLVTMKWWDGLWLNEGFASFMEHFCTDHIFPDYKMWEQYTTDTFAAAQRLDALRSSHPVIVPIKHAEEVEQVFDAISYCKGSTVVRTVLTFIGADKFREGLSNYMKKYAYGNANTPDLWREWSNVSGLDVEALMNSWTKHAGYPHVKVLAEKWTDSSVELTLEQSRFLSDGTTDEEMKDFEWSIPLIFATEGSLSSTVTMNKKVQTVTVPFASTGNANEKWVKINAGQMGLIRVTYSAEMISRLKHGMTSGLVSPVDRASILLDAYSLAKASLAPVENVIDILRALVNESDPCVWSAIQTVLNGLKILIENAGQKEILSKFNAFSSNMVVTALGKVGWDEKPDDTHTMKMLRSLIIQLLDAFCSSEQSVIDESRRRFKLRNDPAILPNEYKAFVYRIILKNGGVKEYEEVMESYTSTEDDQIRKYALYTLGATKDQQLKLRTLDFAVKAGSVKLQDIFYPIGSVSGDAEGANLSWKYYQDNFELIKEMLSSASPSLMHACIINSTRFYTLEKANEVEAFFKDHSLPSSERSISQLLENMRANGKFLETVKISKLMDVAFWN